MTNIATKNPEHNLVPVNRSTRLSPLAVADLARSGISPKQAERAGMFSVEDASTIYPEFQPPPALVLPYFDLDGELITFDLNGAQQPFCRVRYLEQPERAGGFTKHKAQRYSQPLGSPVLPYFPIVPGLDWRKIAADPKQPLVITEGCKKALAGTLAGMNVVGLGGVWNYLRAGALAGTRKLMPELEQFVWEGRDVFLAFDSDAATNPNIVAAEGRLALELGHKRGAKVRSVRIPPDGDKKVGLDDFLLAHGVERFLDLIERAAPMCEADALVAELNTEFAVVCIGGKTVVAHLGGDTHSSRVISMYHPKDFDTRIANRLTTNPTTGKPAPLAKVWLTHPNRREYLGGVAFAPLRDVPADTFNLWSGFSVDPLAGDWSLFRAHILENICSRDRACFEYVMNWLARLIQRPGEPGQVAIVLRGKKGVGKSKFAWWVGQLLRAHFFHATHDEHVTGKFNSHLLTTVLLFADEALFAGNPKNEKILNGLITEENRTSEQKFLPAVTVENCLHLIMATNSNWAVAATENERRFLVCDVSDVQMQNFKYFAAIDVQMENGGLAAMLHELQHRDISKFEVRCIPYTAALVNQQVQTMHGRGDVSGWVYDILSAAEIRGDRSDDPTYSWAGGELEIPKNEARRIFDGWAKQRGRRPTDPGHFGREMHALLPGVLRTKRPRSTAASGRHDKGRAEVYVFRPLEECQAAYRVALAMPDLWVANDE